VVLGVGEHFSDGPRRFADVFVYDTRSDHFHEIGFDVVGQRPNFVFIWEKYLAISVLPVPGGP
jgi:hypothetical protein